jgi:hypothetical protein
LTEEKYEPRDSSVVRNFLPANWQRHTDSKVVFIDVISLSCFSLLSNALRTHNAEEGLLGRDVNSLD